MGKTWEKKDYTSLIDSHIGQSNAKYISANWQKNIHILTKQIMLIYKIYKSGERKGKLEEELAN